MSGLAVKINGADFSAKQLGQVTFLGGSTVEGITINEPEDIGGNQLQFTVTYEPVDALQRDVIWSIEQGGDYASINSNGVLTIGNSAMMSEVVVKAVSQYDAGINDQKSVVISYIEEGRVSLVDNTKLSQAGVMSTDTGYFITDFIEVVGGSAITLADMSSNVVIQYANDKTTVLDYYSTNGNKTLKAGTKYIRISIKKGTNPKAYYTSSGDIIFNNPKCAMFGWYAVRLQGEVSSVLWTCSTKNGNVGMIDDSYTQLDYFNRSSFERTITLLSGTLYLRSSTNYDDVFKDTSNNKEYILTYNTTAY